MDDEEDPEVVISALELDMNGGEDLRPPDEAAAPEEETVITHTRVRLRVKASDVVYRPISTQGRCCTMLRKDLREAAARQTGVTEGFLLRRVVTSMGHTPSPHDDEGRALYFTAIPALDVFLRCNQAHELRTFQHGEARSSRLIALPSTAKLPAPPVPASYRCLFCIAGFDNPCRRAGHMRIKHRWEQQAAMWVPTNACPLLDKKLSTPQTASIHFAERKCLDPKFVKETRGPA